MGPGGLLADPGGAALDESWEHQDLWHDVFHLLHRRDARLRWVKGHLAPEAASMEALQQDRWGNAYADSLAGAASRVAEEA